MRVTILSKDGCKLCDSAIEFATENGLNYEVLKIKSKVELESICNKSVSVYPQILIDNKHLGDFFEFERYIKDDYEPLLDSNETYTVFPIKHMNLWKLYKKAQMSNWTAEEIDLSADMNDWNDRMNSDERHFIKYVLAFFASSDGIVFENINRNFAIDVRLSEAQAFYAYQGHNEMVHGETYSLLIEKYVTDTDEKNKMFRAIQDIPCIKNKATWAQKWFDRETISFAERLIAFACVEGLFFSGSFCAIFWLKKRGLMPGLSFSNELISRDEALHLEFACELFSMLHNRPVYSTVLDIVKNAVEIEKEFITEALPCKLIGMDSLKMSQYIEYVADRLLKQLGYKAHWNSINPFDFMENISLDGKTNFFEKRVGDYGKLDSSTEINFNDDEF
jgi:ribonucleoside-diphosphate reductase subunit M2